MDRVTFTEDQTSMTYTLKVNTDDFIENLEELTFHVFDRRVDDSAGQPYDDSVSSVKAYINNVGGTQVEQGAGGGDEGDGGFPSGDEGDSGFPDGGDDSFPIDAQTSSTPPSFGAGSASDVDMDMDDVEDGSVSFPGHTGSLFFNKYAFAEIRDDNTVVAWGEEGKGGDTSSVSSQLTNVTTVASTHGAFAAIKDNGSVVTWGDEDFGGDSGDVSDRLNGDNAVVSIASTHSAFAAIHDDGTVTTWGKSANGGNPSAAVESRLNDTNNPVESLHSNGSAFAAVHEDGSVTTWGLWFLWWRQLRCLRRTGWHRGC